MAQARYIFPEVTYITAGAVGSPGQRLFYILLGRSDRLVQLWVERAQLEGLAETIERQLAALARQDPVVLAEPEDASGLEVPQGAPIAAQVRVQRLGLGQDRNKEQWVFVAYEAEDADDPTVGCWVGWRQMRAFGHRIQEVCAAGRPRCPLCGEPIDPSGHHCVHHNGHYITRP